MSSRNITHQSQLSEGLATQTTLVDQRGHSRSTPRLPSAFRATSPRPRLFAGRPCGHVVGHGIGDPPLS